MCKSNNMASKLYIANANACFLISKYLMSLTFIAAPRTDR